MRLRDDKARLYSLMGQKVYALYEKGLVKNADLLALCEQASDLDRQVDAAEDEIQQLRTGVDVKTEVQDTEGGIDAEPTAGSSVDNSDASTPASSAASALLPPAASEPHPNDE
jgi:hypothetical protein